MAYRVLIPTPLRPYTGQQDAVELEGGTVGEILSALTSRYAELRRHLYADDGKLRHFVNVYVNDDDIRYLDREATALKSGDVISIVPSVAGGAPVTENGGHAGAVERGSRAIQPSSDPAGGRRRRTAAAEERAACCVSVPAASDRLRRCTWRLPASARSASSTSMPSTPAICNGRSCTARRMSGDRSCSRRAIGCRRSIPKSRIETYETALTSENALALFRDYDVILDGTDNFATRYLVNDACVLLGKPNAYGSIFRFEGQASVFATKGGPCYRCLYPEPPPPGLVPSCAEGGVLGVLPGVIGTIQATESIKLLLGGGATLIGRLLLYDAWNMRFRELKLRRDPACPVCGDHPTVRELIDYEQFCGITRPRPCRGGGALPADLEVSVEELKEHPTSGRPLYLLDVREPHEFQICRIPGSTLIPLGQLPARVTELPTGAGAPEIIVHCRSGVRSAKAVRQLQERGIASRNLKGGILAWIDRDRSDAAPVS